MFKLPHIHDIIKITTFAIPFCFSFHFHLTIGKVYLILTFNGSLFYPFVNSRREYFWHLSFNTLNLFLLRSHFFFFSASLFFFSASLFFFSASLLGLLVFFLRYLAIVSLFFGNTFFFGDFCSCLCGVFACLLGVKWFHFS